MARDTVKPAQASVEVSEIALRGMRFTYRHAGLDQAGDTVLLLHGFPQSSRLWTELMPDLAARGFRCLAPDLRGYSSGARPTELAAYEFHEILADVTAFITAQGCEHLHLIGHDWGAAIGWILVTQMPDRIRSWTAVSIPHLKAFVDGLANDPAQQSKSRYMHIFRRRVLAELLFMAGGHFVMRRMWKRIPAQKCEKYIEEIGNYATLRAALNWYRANEMSQLELPPVTTPTLFIHGRFDEAVAESTVRAAAPYMQGPYELVSLDAGHWVIEEKPLPVHAAILQHLERNRAV